MFRVYYSNQLAYQKDVLANILQKDPNPNPFEQEIIIVQSLGMAQWLKMEIARLVGITGNIQFPYLTTFLWQQYRLLFPTLPKNNIFERETMAWRIMRLIPNYIDKPSFSGLSHYLDNSEQLKAYQLAAKIADLFDQYLVYRPHWLVEWENHRQQTVLNEIMQSISFKIKEQNEISSMIDWQSLLWNALIHEIKQELDDIFLNVSHRAYLQQRYFEKLGNLNESEKNLLPKRIFVFGISSLPITQLNVLKKLSDFCEVHLFFTNPSKFYWGDSKEDKVLEKLALKQSLSSEELNDLLTQQGNPLLSMWGKQGKDFLGLLSDLGTQDIIFYDEFEQENPNLLLQIKKAILALENQSEFHLSDKDNSIQIHSCHSKMREIEVLHNQLLTLFKKDPDLSPNDIIVMSADIDSYAPYINAVFGSYTNTDTRFIPFTLSDQRLNHIDPIIAAFLMLLDINEQKLTAEKILELFNVTAIQEKYHFTQQNLIELREWIKSSGIRSGLYIDNPEWQNYNSWENGLNRLLLGHSVKIDNNIWQNISAFSESYGISAELSGHLAKFIEDLTAWIDFINTPQHYTAWKNKLLWLVENFYQESEENIQTILLLTSEINNLMDKIEQSGFEQDIDSHIISYLFEQQLSQQRNNLNFLIGKVNFCTLLPMRAIPFKVVCLLGMNENEFPRQQAVNNFDLMQYAQQKGDRAKRDDDRYLFLEALLSAQEIFYISYIGQSFSDNRQLLPSILVSQFTDYIQQNLTDKDSFPKKIIQHPMQVFSPKNFSQLEVYNKEWQEIRVENNQHSNFLSEINQISTELGSQIELNHLIAYLQDPIKFFFEHQLGIYLKSNDENIEESEIFNLSPLEKYKLLDNLLYIENNETQNFFQSENLKGHLPANHFADLSTLSLLDEISPLKKELEHYLHQQAQLIEIDKNFDYESFKINLKGYIPNIFNDKLINWHLSNLRDKDIIEHWIYHLLLTTRKDKEYYLKFYYLNKQLQSFYFTPISAEEAENLLKMYIQDYRQSFSALKWVLTKNLANYFEEIKKGKKEYMIICQETLEKQAENNPYLKRILLQTDELPLADIHQSTLKWFQLMIDHLKLEK